MRCEISETPPSELEELTRALATIQDELIALPDDAFAERYELQKLQDELRQQAAAFHVDQDEQRSTEELTRELESLRLQLASIDKQTIKVRTESFGGFGAEGLGSAKSGAVPLNEGIRRGLGGGDVQARIGRIKGILIDRGVEPDEPQ